MLVSSSSTGVEGRGVSPVETSWGPPRGLCEDSGPLVIFSGDCGLTGTGCEGVALCSGTSLFFGLLFGCGARARFPSGFPAAGFPELSGAPHSSTRNWAAKSRFLCRAISDCPQWNALSDGNGNASGHSDIWSASSDMFVESWRACCAHLRIRGTSDGSTLKTRFSMAERGAGRVYILCHVCTRERGVSTRELRVGRHGDH